jgi:RNA polymerase sigma-70 factor (ECF subfamily)
MHSSLADGDLLRRLRESPETAFRDFVERYQPEVYRIVYGIIGYRDFADEVAQQVFVKAYFSMRSLDGRSSLYAWVYRIAVNECYRFLREKPRNDPYTEYSADRHVVRDSNGAKRDFLNKLLERMPEEDRYLLLLRELENPSITYLAEATGLNENTIRLKLFRTRRALARAQRQCYGQTW